MIETNISIKECHKILNKIKREVSKVLVGQTDIIDGILRGMLANGHVLVEGVPGIAKTLVIRALGEATGCATKRIQFTVDLLPTDIMGLTAYDEKKGFYTVKGPIFANFIIADEINRSPPKTQSALLEAMQEKQVTLGKETFPLPKPFFVMANNNPIEASGVYPLPEAQIDRFLFKLYMDYPPAKDLRNIIEKNISLRHFEEYGIKSVASPDKILAMQKIVREKIKHTDKIKDYIVRLVNATRETKKYNITLGKYIEWGASPRAAIGLFIGAKADALLKSQSYIAPQNVKNVIHDVLRHRIVLNYKGQAEGIKSDYIIDEIAKKVPFS